MDRCKAFNELSEKDKEEWFSLTYKKVEHHFDSLYYTVSIENDKVDNDHPGMVALIENLRELKKQKLQNLSESLEFCSLDVHFAGFSIYQYHLQLSENFDIFIADNIPNDDTPRFCIQLRTRMLVYEGEFKAIEISFSYVKFICQNFGLTINSVLENRIDYAFHTNLIQKSVEFFDLDYFREHLKTKTKTFAMFGSTSEYEVNTVWFGQRGSNSYFVRMYNKTREVVEQGYKGFFIEIWYDKKLINKYDRYVYRRAYELKSYVSGVLIGRCEWYIQYGQNDEIKEMLKNLIIQCYANSDNCPQIEKKIRDLLPPVTVVNNIEFQTKRKFYQSCEACINESVFKFKGVQELKRIYKVLFFKREFCDYLTEKVVCFVEKKGIKKEKMVDWWSRIHSCKMKFTDPSVMSLYRSFERSADLARIRKRLLVDIAKFTVLKKNSKDISSLEEDISDVLADINDNDIQAVNQSLKEGKLPRLVNYQYPTIQRRAARQLRGLLTEKIIIEEKEEEKGNESTNT